MTDRRNRDAGLKRARPRFSCGCYLCAPPDRRQTERERLAESLDRQGIAHNLHDKDGEGGSRVLPISDLDAGNSAPVHALAAGPGESKRSGGTCP